MDFEKLTMKFLINRTKLIYGEMILFEEAPNDEEMVLIEITIDIEKFSSKKDNFFSALQDIRKQLESRNIQILCNAAARNVYPSAMQMSMGYGRKAYKLYMGQQARMADVVDIFECDESLDFTSVEEQTLYFDEWIKRLSK